MMKNHLIFFIPFAGCQCLLNLDLRVSRNPCFHHNAAICVLDAMYTPTTTDTEEESGGQVAASSGEERKQTKDEVIYDTQTAS